MKILIKSLLMVSAAFYLGGGKPESILPDFNFSIPGILQLAFNQLPVAIDLFVRHFILHIILQLATSLLS